jgi:hypothetical protein
MNNLAISCSDVGRHADALDVFERVLAFQRRVLPADHPYMVDSMVNLAVSYHKICWAACGGIGFAEESAFVWASEFFKMTQAGLQRIFVASDFCYFHVLCHSVRVFCVPCVYPVVMCCSW